MRTGSHFPATSTAQWMKKASGCLQRWHTSRKITSEHRHPLHSHNASLPINKIVHKIINQQHSIYYVHSRGEQTFWLKGLIGGYTCFAGSERGLQIIFKRYLRSTKFFLPKSLYVWLPVLTTLVPQTVLAAVTDSCFSILGVNGDVAMRKTILKSTFLIRLPFSNLSLINR
jgi:hypothetical protein